MLFEYIYNIISCVKKILLVVLLSSYILSINSVGEYNFRYVLILFCFLLYIYFLLFLVSLNDTKCLNHRNFTFGCMVFT